MHCLNPGTCGLVKFHSMRDFEDGISEPLPGLFSPRKLIWASLGCKHQPVYVRDAVVSKWGKEVWWEIGHSEWTGSQLSNAGSFRKAWTFKAWVCPTVLRRDFKEVSLTPFRLLTFINAKIINLHNFKSLSWRCSVTAAVGNCYNPFSVRPCSSLLLLWKLRQFLWSKSSVWQWD